MSYGSSTSTSGGATGSRTITAFFDSRNDANDAIERLVATGIERSSVSMVEGSGGTQSSTTARSGASVTRDDEGLGFWESLKDLFLPDEDRSTYAEGLRRGGFLVTVRASEADHDRVVDILDDEGTVNMDEREEAWRSEGWTGFSGGRSGSTASGTEGGTAGTIGAAASSAAGALGRAASNVADTVSGASTTETSRSGYGAAAGSPTGSRGGMKEGDEAIPIVEEELQVGKRAVEGGRVRVRSYMVETPVEEQVSLREEHVSVERRPVDRPLTGADAAFKDRTIEATASREEAVVSKDARVKEELVVKKGVEDRTETVSDTVRRTEVEVEVEDDRTTGRGTGTKPGKR